MNKILEEERPESGASSVLDFYFREVKKFPLLSPEEQAVLVMHAQKGDPQAQSALTGSNLRLVISVARKYRGLGLPLEDLIQEGNGGLLKAVEKFRPDKGACFSSYAVWWIRQSIIRGICQQARVIRLPVNVEAQLRSFLRTEQRLAQGSGRNHLPDEIAEEMELSAERVGQLLTAAKPVVSLETRIGSQEEGGMLMDLIEDKKTVSPLAETQKRRQQEQIRTLVSQLGEEERRVIEMRFGFNGSDPHSLKSIAWQLGISRDRVSLLEKRVLRRLRTQLTAEGIELTVSNRGKRLGLPCRIKKSRVKIIAKMRHAAPSVQTRHSNLSS